MMIIGAEDPSIVKKKNNENALRDDRRLAVDELSAMFPQISRSLLHENITDLGYQKLSARWVPKQLTDQHKFSRVEAGQEILRLYNLHGDEFLRSIVTGDETWMHMGGKRFQTDEEVKGDVDVVEGVGGKLLRRRHKKVIERNGDYVEK